MKYFWVVFLVLTSAHANVLGRSSRDRHLGDVAADNRFLQIVNSLTSWPDSAKNVSWIGNLLNPNEIQKRYEVVVVRWDAENMLMGWNQSMFGIVSTKLRRPNWNEIPLLPFSLRQGPAALTQIRIAFEDSVEPASNLDIINHSSTGECGLVHTTASGRLEAFGNLFQNDKLVLPLPVTSFGTQDSFITNLTCFHATQLPNGEAVLVISELPMNIVRVKPAPAELEAEPSAALPEPPAPSPLPQPSKMVRRVSPRPSLASVPRLEEVDDYADVLLWLLHGCLGDEPPLSRSLELASRDEDRALAESIHRVCHAEISQPLLYEAVSEYLTCNDMENVGRCSNEEENLSKAKLAEIVDEILETIAFTVTDPISRGASQPELAWLHKTEVVFRSTGGDDYLIVSGAVNAANQRCPFEMEVPIDNSWWSEFGYKKKTVIQTCGYSLAASYSKINITKELALALSNVDGDVLDWIVFNLDLELDALEIERNWDHGESLMIRGWKGDYQFQDGPMRVGLKPYQWTSRGLCDTCEVTNDISVLTADWVPLRQIGGNPLLTIFGDVSSEYPGYRFQKFFYQETWGIRYPEIIIRYASF